MQLNILKIFNKIKVEQARAFQAAEWLRKNFSSEYMVYSVPKNFNPNKPEWCVWDIKRNTHFLIRASSRVFLLFAESKGFKCSD